MVDLSSHLSPTMAENLINWRPTDLKKFWPVHSFWQRLEESKYYTTVASTVDNTGGLLVQQVTYLGTTTNYIYIPPHYCNPVVILTAKIKYLQQILQLKRPSSLAQNEATIWTNAMDACKRNLVFHTEVLNDFYYDVSVAFYGDQDPADSLPSTPFNEEFRSNTLDSWLYVEHFAATHHPPTYDEFINILGVETHPIDIPLEGA
jgi:hypothetical protein